MLLNGKWNEGEAAHALGLMEAWPAPGAGQRSFLELARRRLAVPPAAASLETLGPARRPETLELLLVLTCLGAEVSDPQLELLEALNRQLERPTPWVDLVRAARAGRRSRATMTLAQRSPDSRALFRTAWRQGGLFGAFPVLLSLLGRGPKNTAVAARYTGLGLLPPDTLGFAFFTHMRSRGLPMPGDLMHVITGFDTDARGEGRLAGFYAGATARHPVEGADPFTFVMVGLLTFHLGYPIGPTFVGAERGVVDPAELLAFIELGSQVPLDVIQAWRFEEDLEKPLAAVRARFGLTAAGAISSAARG
jgi:hypothetical protein